MTDMEPYIIKARYYETDQMGIIHHSNYIRWMEEARIDMMEQMGYPYRRFEEMGYLSPVLRAECEYKKSVKFGDTVKIVISLGDCGRLKFSLNYQMYNLSQGGVLCAAGSTRHCFLNRETGLPVMMDKELGEFFEAMKSMASE